MSSIGDYKKCGRCGEYGWTDTHRCKPVWYAGEPDYYSPDHPESLNDLSRVHARDAEDAAVKWAKQQDWEAEEDFLRSGYVDIITVSPSGDAFRVHVLAEAVVEYYCESKVGAPGITTDPCPICGDTGMAETDTPKGTISRECECQTREVI